MFEYNTVEYVRCLPSVEGYYLHVISVNGTEVRIHSQKTEDEYRKTLESARGAAIEAESQKKAAETGEEENESIY